MAFTASPQLGKTQRNLWLETDSRFHPEPIGPFEDEAVKDQATAQDHFNAIREIKLKEKHGSKFPQTTYVHHYPPKEVPATDPCTPEPGPPVPFESTSEYHDQYPEKAVQPRPVPDSGERQSPMPFKGDTTYSRHYLPFQPEAGEPRPRFQGSIPDPDMASFLNDTFNTSNRVHYPAHPATPPVWPPVPDARPIKPSMVHSSTYTDAYVPKHITPLRAIPLELPLSAPFCGTTEYQSEYPPKPIPKDLPHLTGLISKDGLPLPLPRQSLGCEFWHKGVTDNYYVLIPRTLEAPCSGRQIFTTVHDNQETACILVLYGEDPVASNNKLLGQFDLTRIPPAPKDVPRIEVTFRLDANLVLTAEARDLDTHRHKLWQQRGGVILLHA